MHIPDQVHIRESMFRVNENYLKLPGSYLFSTIAKKVAAYQKENPDKKLIRLGIGDVTLPIAPAIIDAMHKAVDEMGHAETFHPPLTQTLPGPLNPQRRRSKA